MAAFAIATSVAVVDWLRRGRPVPTITPTEWDAAVRDRQELRADLRLLREELTAERERTALQLAASDGWRQRLFALQEQAALELTDLRAVQGALQMDYRTLLVHVEDIYHAVAQEPDHGAAILGRLTTPRPGVHLAAHPAIKPKTPDISAAARQDLIRILESVPRLREQYTERTRLLADLPAAFVGSLARNAVAVIDLSTIVRQAADWDPEVLLVLMRNATAISGTGTAGAELRRWQAQFLPH